MLTTYYHYTFRILTGTTQAAEQVKVCRLTRGIVREVEIVFPRGLAGLVGVRLFRSTRQVIPQNPVEWLVTDGETITAKVDVDLSQEPYELELRGYNEDEVYNHTIRARFTIETLPAEGVALTPQQESAQLIEQLGLKEEVSVETPGEEE
jgi:hypothetical protein